MRNEHDLLRALRNYDGLVEPALARCTPTDIKRVNRRVFRIASVAGQAIPPVYCKFCEVFPDNDEAFTEFDNLATFKAHNTLSELDCPEPVQILETERVLITREALAPKPVKNWLRCLRVPSKQERDLCCRWLRTFHNLPHRSGNNQHLNFTQAADYYVSQLQGALAPQHEVLVRAIRLRDVLGDFGGTVRLATHVHGDFSARNCTFDRGRITVFDVPSNLVASPYYDLAHFAVSVEITAAVNFRPSINSFDFLSELRRFYFVGSMFDIRSDEAEALRFQALALLKFAVRHFDRVGYTPRPIAAVFSAHASRIYSRLMADVHRRLMATKARICTPAW